MKAKFSALWAVVGLCAFAAYRVVEQWTGLWALGLIAGVAVGVAGPFAQRLLVQSQTNDDAVVATEHGPNGRVEAIEVFWRPG